MLGRLDDILLLHILLDLVPGVAPGGGSGDGGQRLAIAAPHGASQQAARHSAHHASGDAMLVLHRRLTTHLDVFALLMRGHAGLDDLLHRDDIGEGRLRHRLVPGDSACPQHHHRDAAHGHSLDH